MKLSLSMCLLQGLLVRLGVSRLMRRLLKLLCFLLMSLLHLLLHAGVHVMLLQQQCGWSLRVDYAWGLWMQL